MSRPATLRQSSRKGKKAWRKNIDIEDIESGLAKSKDLEITHGATQISDLSDAKLFQIDVEGDEGLKKNLIKRKQIKKSIKSREILDAISSISKVEPVSRHNRPKSNDKKDKTIQGVSAKKLKKLLELSGKSLSTTDRMAADLERNGIIRKSAKGKQDLWGAENELESVKKMTSPNPSYLKGITVETKTKLVLPEELFYQSSSSWSTSTVQPKTMKLAPHKVKDFDELPHAGKSYNPDTENWENLIQKEYTIEQEKETRRIEIEQYKLKIQHLMATVDDNEEEDDTSDEEEEEDNAEENGKDGENVEEKRLSINPVVQNKKKTKYQRNKQRRHEAKVKIHQEIKTLKEQVKALEKLDEISKEMVLPDASSITKIGNDINLRIQKKQKLGSKHKVMEDALEVKFKDELNGSLRQLRPEGNLLYDNVRKLQSSGKIEARIPTRKGRKHKAKITEKWTYKDYK